MNDFTGGLINYLTVTTFTQGTPLVEQSSIHHDGPQTTLLMRSLVN